MFQDIAMDLTSLTFHTQLVLQVSLKDCKISNNLSTQFELLSGFIDLLLNIPD
jgi:hypothetical protein